MPGASTPLDCEPHPRRTTGSPPARARHGRPPSPPRRVNGDAPPVGGPAAGSPTAASLRVTIDPRFNGPLTSANGGYACGTVARLVDGPADVSLRRPIPLGTPLDLERHDDGSVTLHDGDALLAVGGPALPLDAEPPVRPTVGDAREAMRGARTARPELLARCYVCSPARPDGLGVHFAQLPSAPGVTCSLVSLHAGVPSLDGVVAREVVWAALDCPSYVPGLWEAKRPSVLARLTGELLAPVHVGEPVVAVGWDLGAEGRNRHTASALLDAGGRTLALAQALWIELRA